MEILKGAIRNHVARVVGYTRVVFVCAICIELYMENNKKSQFHHSILFPLPLVMAVAVAAKSRPSLVPIFDR